MDTRTTLSNTAEHLLRTAGPDGFSFADLAAAADIRKASVHYHFPTKADLTRSVLSGYIKRFWASLAAQENAAPDAKLAALAELYRDAMADGSKLCLCVALSIAPGSLADDITQTVHDFHKDLVNWINAALGQDDPQLALDLLASLQGAQLVARSFAGTATFNTIANAAVQRALSS